METNNLLQGLEHEILANGNVVPVLQETVIKPVSKKFKQYIISYAGDGAPLHQKDIVKLGKHLTKIVAGIISKGYDRVVIRTGGNSGAEQALEYISLDPMIKDKVFFIIYLPFAAFNKDMFAERKAYYDVLPKKFIFIDKYPELVNKEYAKTDGLKRMYARNRAYVAGVKGENSNVLIYYPPRDMKQSHLKSIIGQAKKHNIPVVNIVNHMKPKGGK